MGRAAELPPLRPDRPPAFTATTSIVLDAEGHATLSVSISLPYADLQWIKLQRGFAAGAELAVVFEPGAGGPQYGDAWERRVLAPDFQSTIRSTMVENKSFALPPGRYELRVRVRDLNSDQGSMARGPVEVPDYSRVPLGLAELELGTADSSGVFTAVPTRRFGIEVQALAGRVTLYDRRPGAWPRSYPLQYRVLDDTGEERVSGRRQATLSRSGEPVVLRPDSSDLFIGAYVFQVELVEGRSRQHIERSFEVETHSPPRGREFERLLEPLSYIADSREVDRLRSVPVDQQAAAWEAFWKRRDPTPDTPRNEAMLEFFRRLRYTEQHFQNFGPGWRSDMGRIYIKFGAPDQIENRPAGAGAPELEIWTYDQPRRQFVFADRDGFGRFVLVSASPE